MKDDTRDHFEVIVSMISGMAINYTLTMIIFGTGAMETFGISLIFFVFSYLRSYIIRRIFRKGEVK